MTNFRQNITRIKGLSDKRRLPRLGIIRLGIKLKSKKTGQEYPSETEYFVCPDEVKAIYGAEPKELDILVPLNDIDCVLPMAYKHYGSSRGLICTGDGEEAYRVNADTGEMEQRECPCELLEDGKCKQSAAFMFMLPKVSMGGIYQIRTSSFNSIIDLQSGLDFVQALIGRFAMIPLTLRRVKTETHFEGKKQNHYTMQVIFAGNIDTINQLKSDTEKILSHSQYALPALVDENPEYDPVDAVVEDEEDTGQQQINNEKVNHIIKFIDSDETVEELMKRHKINEKFINSLPADLNKKVMDAFSARKAVILAKTPSDKSKGEKGTQPPVDDSGAYGGPPPPREQAIIECREMLGGVGKAGLPEMMTRLKKTPNFQGMPKEDQERIFAYYDELMALPE